MVSETVIRLTRRYLSLLREHGFNVHRAVLFGSQVRGGAHADSDIDLLILSTDFETLTWKQEEQLWMLTARLDTRLEPIPCGERRWQMDEVSPLLEAARLEGVVVDIEAEVPLYPAREEFDEQGMAQVGGP
jgi:predicted nucleotidyltransferase